MRSVGGEFESEEVPVGMMRVSELRMPGSLPARLTARTCPKHSTLSAADSPDSL